MLEGLGGVSKIPELQRRILFTLLLLAVYRVGVFIPTPGIDNTALLAFFEHARGSMMGLMDLFTGGALSSFSIFALGIMPYITSSIILSLLTVAIPHLEKLSKEGESGRRKMNQWTRFLTIGVLILQGPAYIANLYHQVPSAFVYGNSFGFVAYATTILIAGTMFIMWLGEKITDKGIGNGISLIIMIGIVARLPHALLAEVNARFQTASGSAIMLILELVLLFLVFMVALIGAVDLGLAKLVLQVFG